MFLVNKKTQKCVRFPYRNVCHPFTYQATNEHRNKVQIYCDSTIKCVECPLYILQVITYMIVKVMLQLIRFTARMLEYLTTKYFSGLHFSYLLAVCKRWVSTVPIVYSIPHTSSAGFVQWGSNDARFWGRVNSQGL